MALLKAQRRARTFAGLVKFSVNVSILFTELPFLERFAAVREAGFDAVEFWWPAGEDLDALIDAVEATGLEVALINFDAGDMPAGDRGLLADPARKERFRANVPVALSLAARLRCTRLNALVGHRLEGHDLDEQLGRVRDNLRWAADRAAPHGARVLVEAVNTLENGPYLVASTDAALELIASTGRDNVGLQYDAYHMQRMEGDVVATLRRHVHQIAHIQIADSPDRHQPGTGELDYGFILAELARLGYDGYVGLEYKPLGPSAASFGWVPDLVGAAQ
jgi:hydroxypyruvate isomerase